MEGGVLKRAIFWVFEPHKWSFLLGGMYGTFAHVSPIISWFWSGSFWVVLTIYEVLREVFKNNNFRLKFSQISMKRAISTEKDPQKAHQVCEYWNYVYYFVNLPIFKDKSEEYTLRIQHFGVLTVFFGLIAVKPPWGGVLGVREAVKALVKVEFWLVDWSLISPNWKGEVQTMIIV